MNPGAWRAAAVALATLLAPVTAPVAAGGAGPAPVADTHLHYTWSQAELVSPEQAVAILRRNGVELAVVSGLPPELALRLAEAGGDWIRPIFGVYLDALGRETWYRDDRALQAARVALASGRYHGIGEVHLHAGLPPARDNPRLEGLITLAGEYQVPFLIHTDTSNYRYFLPICRKFPQTRFQWAHAGGILPAAQVAALLEACPNVWAELSARDPWRHVSAPITSADGRLLPEWEALVRTYPTRILIGSDPVWPVARRDSWDQPDSGWLRLDDFLGFHRGWSAALPSPLRQQILRENARALYPDTERRPTKGDQ